MLAIGKPEVLVILAPAIVGGALAFRAPHSRTALIWSALLVCATAVVSLIGGVGYLYLLLVGLLIVAAVVGDDRPTPDRPPDHGFSQ